MRWPEARALKDAAAVFLSTSAAWFIGTVSWGSGGLPALALAPAVVPLWAAQPDRLRAWMVMFGYYLAAGRGLPSGAANFFGSQVPIGQPIAMWVLASALLAAAWAIAWGRAGHVWRVPMALAITIVPPLGIIGWTNPVTAAGVYFPGLGWAGLAIMAGLMAAFCYRRSRLGAVLILSLAGMLAAEREPPNAPGWIKAQQTRFGGSGHGGRDFVLDYEANVKMIGRARASVATIQLYPEGVAGQWGSTTQDLWAPALQELAAQGRSVLLGVEVPAEGTQRYRNALVLAGSESGMFTQRVPVPVSMWRPWADDGAESDLFGDGIGMLHGQRVAVLICYEQGIVWPMLISQASRPSLLIGASNTYWAKGTSIPSIQTASMTAWSYLFGTPLVMAFNN